MTNLENKLIELGYEIEMENSENDKIYVKTFEIQGIKLNIQIIEDKISRSTITVACRFSYEDNITHYINKAQATLENDVKALKPFQSLTKMQQKLLELGYEKEKYTVNQNLFTKMDEASITIRLNNENTEIIDYFVYTPEQNIRPKRFEKLAKAYNTLTKDLEVLSEIV